MRNFRTLSVWQKSVEVVVEIYKLAEKLPNEEKYGLKSQMCRAAVSIPSNIAEGCSRKSDAEFKRFLEVAGGSAFELETQVEIIEKLDLVKSMKLESVKYKIVEVQKMISGLMSKVGKTKTFTLSTLS